MARRLFLLAFIACNILSACISLNSYQKIQLSAINIKHFEDKIFTIRDKSAKSVKFFTHEIEYLGYTVIPFKNLSSGHSRLLSCVGEIGNPHDPPIR